MAFGVWAVYILFVWASHEMVPAAGFFMHWVLPLVAAFMFMSAIASLLVKLGVFGRGITRTPTCSAKYRPVHCTGVSSSGIAARPFSIRFAIQNPEYARDVERLN